MYRTIVYIYKGEKEKKIICSPDAVTDVILSHRWPVIKIE